MSAEMANQSRLPTFIETSIEIGDGLRRALVTNNAVS